MVAQGGQSLDGGMDPPSAGGGLVHHLVLLHAVTAAVGGRRRVCGNVFHQPAPAEGLHDSTLCANLSLYLNMFCVCVCCMCLFCV